MIPNTLLVLVLAVILAVSGCMVIVTPDDGRVVVSIGSRPAAEIAPEPAPPPTERAKP